MELLNHSFFNIKLKLKPVEGCRMVNPLS